MSLDFRFENLPCVDSRRNLDVDKSKGLELNFCPARACEETGPGEIIWQCGASFDFAGVEVYRA